MSQHDRARHLIIAAAVEPLATEDHSWLDAHLASCAACSAYADELGAATAAVRQISVSADLALVARTQSLVRARAAELDRQDRAATLLWTAIALTAVAAGISTRLFWQAFQTLGESFHLSYTTSVVAFLLWWLMPSLFASALLLARGFQRPGATLNGFHR